MSDVKAVGTFVKQHHHIYREHAYLQWGHSEQIIGSFLLLNPGKAGEKKLHELSEGDRILMGVELDPTMEQIVKFIEAICGPTPSGRVNLYNLFSLRNTHLTQGIKKFEAQCDLGNIEVKNQVVPVEELQRNPWICIAWGVADEKFKHLHEAKLMWLDQIKVSGIKSFGKKHKHKELSYYHICPHIISQRALVVKELIEIYKLEVEKEAPCRCQVTFTVNAAKPNLFFPPYHSYHAEDALLDFGWSVSEVNPEIIVYGFSQLLIKKGLKLRGYQYTEGGSGNGVAWAIPLDKELPSVNECEFVEDAFLTPPKPNFALEDFMLAIEGDHSPLSYLQAAICWHELNEFGALGHGVSWGQDQLLPINEDDFQAFDHVQEYLESIQPWESLNEIPDTLHPHFFYERGYPTIVFYTINDLGQITLNRYTHTFSQKDYTQKVQRDVIDYVRQV